MDRKEMKEEFLTLLRSTEREGIEDLIEALEEMGFFTAPASANHHLNVEGGLLEHSLNVYECLTQIVPRLHEKYGFTFPDESLAIAALLHDLCKVNCYRESQRNVKGPDGKWTAVPYYEFDDQLPYGHGEKSVYIATGFMRLERHEAFAIRYHMGFSVEGDARNVGAAFEKFPLAMALFIADMEATYYLEGKK